MSAAKVALSAAYQSAVSDGGHPSTHVGGPIRDDEWNRSNFPYAAAIADATGLDFVQLAVVDYANGSYGVDAVVSALTHDDSGAAEARRLAGIHKLGDSSDEDRAAAALASLAGGGADADAILDAFVQAFVFRSNTDPPWAPSPESYPLSAQIAALSGLSFEKLATIESKGGTDGLELTVRRFPELAAREGCLALF